MTHPLPPVSTSLIVVAVSAKKLIYLLLTGRDKHFEKVREYKIGYSDDGKTFTEYKEDGKIRVSC